MTELGRYRKQMFVDDEKRLRDWQKELGLSTFAEVLHVVCYAYQNQLDQKEIIKQQKEMKEKLTVIGIKLAALSELSSDFYHKNEYGLEEQRSSSFVGTDCSAWAVAEKKALSRGDVWQPMTSEESKQRRAELKARAEKMIRQIDEALAKGKNNDC